MAKADRQGGRAGLRSRQAAHAHEEEDEVSYSDDRQALPDVEPEQDQHPTGDHVDERGIGREPRPEQLLGRAMPIGVRDDVDPVRFDLAELVDRLPLDLRDLRALTAADHWPPLSCPCLRWGEISKTRRRPPL
jgi:hypothetical protein